MYQLLEHELSQNEDDDRISRGLEKGTNQIGKQSSATNLVPPTWQSDRHKSNSMN